MPDEPIPNPSPSEPSGAGENASAEDDLDALLAEASELVGGLTDEVGVPEEPPASSQATRPAGPDDTDAPGIESQLDELEGLLGDTDQEIGDAPPATEAKTEPVPTGEPDVTVPDPSTSPVEAPTTNIDSQLAALHNLLEQADAVEDAEAPVDDAPDPVASDDSEATSAAPAPVPDFMSEFTTSEETPDANPEPSEPPAAATGADAVPDFMSEFTTSEASPDASPEATEPPAAAEEAAAVPDFMAEFTSTAPETEGTDSAAPDADPQTPSPTTPKDVDHSLKQGANTVQDKKPVAGPPQKLADSIEEELKELRPAELPATRSRGAARRLLGQIATPLTPVAFKTCERGVRVLEAIDRPTQRLGYRPRRLAGWLAIATIWASLIVYFSSLF